MTRTQLYLQSSQYEDIKRLAKTTNQTFAEVVREFIDEGLKQKRLKTPGRGLASLAELGITGGPPDLASNLDEYMYGGKTWVNEQK